MAAQDIINELKGFDVSELELDNIGSWPLAIRIIVWVVAFVGLITLGYVYVISDLQQQLATEQKREVTLKKEFGEKAAKAANLAIYRKQMEEMEASFGALVSQLPSDTEVPGLLEDITNKGVLNGLEITTINLKPEVSKEFYIELPIDIVVKGSYHDIGAFVSGISGLPRIVTLHSFKITPDKSEQGLLSMSIVAKTYRYKNMEEG